MDDMMTMIKEIDDWLESNNIHNYSIWHNCSIAAAVADAAVLPRLNELEHDNRTATKNKYKVSTCTPFINKNN